LADLSEAEATGMGPPTSRSEHVGKTETARSKPTARTEAKETTVEPEADPHPARDEEVKAAGKTTN